MAIDSSIFGQLQTPDFLGAFQKGASIANGIKDQKRQDLAFKAEQEQKQQKALAEKREKEVQLLARSGRNIKDQAGYDSLLKTASFLGHDISKLPAQWGPDAQGLLANLSSNELGVDKQIGFENDAKQFDYTKEKDNRTFANQDRAFGLDQKQFEETKKKNERDYNVTLTNMGLTREEFEEKKNQNAFGNDLKAKELALMEREKTKKEKYLDAKMAEMQAKAAGKTPEQDKALLKKQNEFASRYGSIVAEAEKLKQLVKDNGTAELVGPHEKNLAQSIDSIAIDAAKLFDPESVARESEVAAFRKMLFEPGNSMQFDSTAMSTVDNFQKMIQERALREAEASGNAGFSERLAKSTPLGGQDTTPGFINEAQAAGSSFERALKAAPNMAPQDQSAFQWASQNAQDPRAQQILMNLNGKYGGR